MTRSPGFLTFPCANTRAFPQPAGLCNARKPSSCIARSRPSARCPPKMSHTDSMTNNDTGALGFALSDAPLVAFHLANGDFSKWARPGAYAVRDVTGELVYVGYARDVGKRLAFHITQVPQLCVSFQTYLPDIPRAEITPDLLEGVLEYWVRENGRMPKGNVEDRGLWEGTAADRKASVSQKKSQHTAPSRTQSTSPTTAAPDPAGRRKGPQYSGGEETEPEPAIPVRERRTPRRRVSERAPFRANGNTFRSGPAQRRRGESWEPANDDFVEVNVDPLDPFTATSHKRTTRDGVWDPSGGEDDGEDWIPIFGLVGIASLIWLFSVLGNAIPTTAPSLGM